MNSTGQPKPAFHRKRVFRPLKKSSESWAFMHIDGKIEEKRERREQRC